jgi:alkylhydroperoxidase family enzyme
VDEDLSMARLEPAHRRTLATRFCMWMMRRMLGRDLRPYKIAAHAPRMVPGLTLMNAVFETGSWAIDANLRKLIHLRVATLIGCVF